jgi:hypothetical protein
MPRVYARRPDEHGTVPEAIFFELIPRASTLAHP